MEPWKHTWKTLDLGCELNTIETGIHSGMFIGNWVWSSHKVIHDPKPCFLKCCFTFQNVGVLSEVLLCFDYQGHPTYNCTVWFKITIFGVLPLFTLISCFFKIYTLLLLCQLELSIFSVYINKWSHINLSLGLFWTQHFTFLTFFHIQAVWIRWC